MNDKAPFVEFTFHGLPVGEFTESNLPSVPGTYLFEPYRGPGHYHMHMYFKEHAVVECEFSHDSGRIYFLVSDFPKMGSMVVSQTARSPILPEYIERMKLVEQLFGPRPA